MTLNEWIAVIVFFDLVAILTVLIVVHGGNRKRMPCMNVEHPCYECRLEMAR